ncbi:MAG: peptidase [Betaproteobacteria bacterium]|nr:peptidase [Betaproteobacteria bacterium]
MPEKDPDIPRLPRLREDLRLHEGATQADGAPSWRILDPVRNRFFEIGWLEFEVLRRWGDARDAIDLVERVARETTLRPSAAEIAEVLEFLKRNQLVQTGDEADRRGLRTRWLAGARPWHVMLLHHYLFFRVPLVRPDRFLDATLPWARRLAGPWLLPFLGLVATIDLVLVTRQWESFRQTFLYFFNLEGLVFYGLAAAFSKVVHEFAHAYTAKHYGVRVPTMGLAFLVMWPMLYTDTSEAWKLSNPRDRFRIAAAGIAAELVLALLATLVWSVVAEGPLKSVFFLLATTTWVITLAINLSPFMRFDGYFLLSDALDIPNLHERSGALARHWMRSTIFGLSEAPAEGQWTGSQRAALIVFALMTWLYRLVLFLGIALLVYHLFFKLLGIFLMLVEIVWFVVRPVAAEVTYLWSRRAEMRVAAAPATAVVIIALGLLWLLPVATHVSAPALLRSSEEQAVFSPVPARVAEVAVVAGQSVKKGELLARLESPDLASRIDKAEVRVRSFQIELSLRPTSTSRLERAAVVQQQLAESLADLQGAKDEAAQLVLVADHDGVVRDVPFDLAAGRWLNPKQLLLRVVRQDAIIEAFVSETQVGALTIGQRVHFYPAAAGRAVMGGTIKTIDTAASAQIPRPLLASTYGGDIAVSTNHARELRAHEAVYRVLIGIDPGTPAAEQVLRGTARVDTGLFAVAANFFSRLAAIIVRESGF